MQNSILIKKSNGKSENGPSYVFGLHLGPSEEYGPWTSWLNYNLNLLLLKTLIL